MSIQYNNRIELEITSKCTLRCARCPRTMEKDTRYLWDYGNIDKDVLINAIPETTHQILMCGGYGDPLYHPDFAEIVVGLKEKTNASISIDTNGSYLTKDKWIKSVSCLTQGDCITFSVDGTPSNFTKYRENGDWASIRIGMETAVRSRAMVMWKYIIFSYNYKVENLIEVYNLCKEIGIPALQLVSTRNVNEKLFIEQEEYKKELEKFNDYLETIPLEERLHVSIKITPMWDNKNPSRAIRLSGFRTSFWPEEDEIKKHKPETIYANGSNTIPKKKDDIVIGPITNLTHVSPQCTNYPRWNFFMNSGGYLMPCCFSNTKKQMFFKQANLSAKEIEQISVYNNSIEDILKSNAYQKIIDSFDSQIICREACPK